ncbi:MAG: glutamate 5-kinase [Nitrospirae bacterium]|nr:glutamate 5-kinase [Nitrospirota bacterium]
MKRIVIKIGSNILADDKEGLNMKRLAAIVSDIVEMKSHGCEIVVVSSGAVAAGMKKLGLSTKPKEIMLKQAAAAIGQSSLMWAYEKTFGDHDTKVAQILLTRDDLSNRKRYINSKNTLLTLISYGVVPIVNENDTVVTDEIKFGDNDNLAALVSILIEADHLIILSDVDGLYKEDPRINPEAELIAVVEEIDHSIEKNAGGAGSQLGTGGMYSKVLAARKATSHGIAVTIVNGREKGHLVSLLRGRPRGTFFKPGTERLSHRKGWIAYSSRAMGSVELDEGAVRAITGMGRSLLPSGITSVSGDFELGDPVYCLDARGKRLAKGLTNYSADDIRKVMGRQSSEIEGILGYKYSEEIIHRDNLVLLQS